MSVGDVPYRLGAGSRYDAFYPSDQDYSGRTWPASSPLYSARSPLCTPA